MNSGLIIEDVPQTRDWLTGLLKASFPGIHIDSAGTVQAGIRKIRAHKHDIALVDLGLPDGSGVECLIKRTVCWPDMPSVVSTSFEDDKHLFLALQAGAVGYILKDQNDEEIIQLLKGIDAGARPLSPRIAQKIMSHFIDHKRESPIDDIPEQLTPSEIEVLSHIARGLTVPETANVLNKSRHTVSSQLKSVYSKLNVSSRAEVTRLAIQWRIA